MDLAIFSAINAAHTPFADAALLTITWAGAGAGVWYALALVALCWPRHRAAAWRVCLALTLTLIVANLVIKPIVNRPRPFQSGGVGVRVVQSPAPTTSSFPSGHAATAVAGALALTRIWPGAAWALWSLAVAIALSRIYVGVHYPSDVLAGAIVGLACAWLVLAGRHPSTWSRLAEPPPGVVHLP